MNSRYNDIRYTIRTIIGEHPTEKTVNVLKIFLDKGSRMRKRRMKNMEEGRTERKKKKTKGKKKKKEKKGYG